MHNILMHFPDHTEIPANKDEFKRFLKNIEFVNKKFFIKISDFGLSKKVESIESFINHEN